MTLRRLSLRCALACALALVLHVPAPAKESDQWLPIDPADLAMKEEPLAPGAPAIYLYREIASDDVEGDAEYYFRIKILTEAGKKWGNVEIPYDTSSAHVNNISGRTIQPDGTITDFQGKPLDQTVLRAHGEKVLEKTFSMPNVEVGSIIEYKYRIYWDSQMLYRTTWIVTADLYTRKMHCTLKPYMEGPYQVLVQSQRLPVATVPTATGKGGLIRFDIQDIPGIESEDFMPPTDAIQGQLDFYYATAQTIDPTKYWNQAGKDWNTAYEMFIGHSSGILDEAAKVAPPSDPPETRLRKLYARAQQIRDLSIETEKTEGEVKAEKLRDINSVDDVLKNGYGYDLDINLFFVALARAAAFDASSVKIPDRARYFFNPKILDRRQMDTDIVVVKLNGQDIYLDPASPHCGFGQLPWPESGVQGLKLDTQGGAFVGVTAPQSSGAVIERIATLQMADDGWLQGKLVVTFSGQEAMSLRQDADDQDEADRKKALIDKVASWLPVGAAITLTNEPDWAGSDSPLRAEFDVRTRTVSASTGHLVLITESLFSDADLPRFDHPQRTYPIYFDYPWEVHDDITLVLPLTLEPGNLPSPVQRVTPFGNYLLSCTTQAGTFHVERQVTLSDIYYEARAYDALRAYFDGARNADQQQLVLQVAGTQAGH